ncbi:MAG: multidrug transporter MatE [Neisseria sp.]|jgi:1-(5-phosphoribosyl)-5-((5'-phosphoribosylamino)methylideneamino)imidazole-4-carboxamide isomerase|uniref:multidrug transporter MatE n=1 Tax=Neisseria sp. TaxID=192066 RepID=UPI00262B1700|nr:multidrug transporter MatE [uncultured Neisseria sp.]
MLEAFVLGFWIIWSSNRDIYALSESLWFTLLAAVLHQLTDFSMPVINQQWMMSNGALWLYVAVAFYLVNRLSNSFMATMLMAAAASIGYYQLAAHLPDWISGLSA